MIMARRAKRFPFCVPIVSRYIDHRTRTHIHFVNGQTGLSEGWVNTSRLACGRTCPGCPGSAPSAASTCTCRVVRDHVFSLPLRDQSHVEGHEICVLTRRDEIAQHGPSGPWVYGRAWCRNYRNYRERYVASRYRGRGNLSEPRTCRDINLRQ